MCSRSYKAHPTNTTYDRHTDASAACLECDEAWNNSTAYEQSRIHAVISGHKTIYLVITSEYWHQIPVK